MGGRVRKLQSGNGLSGEGWDGQASLKAFGRRERRSEAEHLALAC